MKILTMKKMITAAAGLAAMGMASANAAVLDFGGEAEFGIGERGFADGTTLPASAFLDFGVTLRALYDPDGAGVGAPQQRVNPYLDGPGGGAPTAGLGVCRALDAQNQCDPGSDDNITFGEAVQIAFTGAPGGRFDVRYLSFVGDGHVDFNGNNTNTLLVGTNAGSVTRYTFAGAVAAALSGAFLNVLSIEFYFDDGTWDALGLNANGLQQNGDQFYIGSISDVPIPAALPLLLSGLAGLGFASRRKRKTA